MTPVFIFSLPRSGSTLLQALLSSHPSVSTKSELWFLLPLFFARREHSTFSVYNHTLSARAFNDALASKAVGDRAYSHAVNEFAYTIYSELCEPDSQYFIDKTPRYHLIVDDILNTFDKAKFIFLWRHPLDVVSSMINTWQNGNWLLYKYYVDLYGGIDNLVRSFQENDGVYSLRYEDLAGDVEKTMDSVLNYIGLEAKMSWEGTDLAVPEGEMGDKNIREGVRSSKVTTSSIGQWEAAITSRVRQSWMINYIKWIGAERLSLMGYDYSSTLKRIKINTDKHGTLLQDLFYSGLSYSTRFVEPHIIRARLKGGGSRDEVHL